MRDALTTGGNALPKDDPANVTRFRSAAAKAHRCVFSVASDGLGRRKVITSPDERADYQPNKLVRRNRIEPSQDGYYAAFRIYPGAVTPGADCEKTLR